MIGSLLHLLLLYFFVARFGQSHARSVECRRSSSESTLEACSLHVDGPIAQLVEQLAFNQWVAGSSPARLTNIINNLGQRFDIEVAALFILVCE